MSSSESDSSISPGYPLLSSSPLPRNRPTRTIKHTHKMAQLASNMGELLHENMLKTLSPPCDYIYVRTSPALTGLLIIATSLCSGISHLHDFFLPAHKEGKERKGEKGDHGGLKKTQVHTCCMTTYL